MNEKESPIVAPGQGLNRWLPALIAFCVFCGVLLLLLLWRQADQQISQSEMKSLDEFSAMISSPVRMRPTVSPVSEIRKLIKTAGGKRALQELEDTLPLLAYSPQHHELYYATSDTLEGEKSKYDFNFIKSGTKNISSSCGFISGLRIESIELQDDQLTVVLRVDEKPGSYVLDALKFEPNARYQKSFDLGEIRTREHPRLNSEDLNDYEGYSKIE